MVVFGYFNSFFTKKTFYRTQLIFMSNLKYLIFPYLSIAIRGEWYDGLVSPSIHAVGWHKVPTPRFAGIAKH